MSLGENVIKDKIIYIYMTEVVLNEVKNLIINELNKTLSSVNKQCLAKKGNGKRCTTNVKDISDDLCNRHKKCKNVELFKINYDILNSVIYHNHLPNEECNKTCPKFNKQ